MNTIQFNKLSELHNGETIFFTKTDFIVSDLVAISKLKTFLMEKKTKIYDLWNNLITNIK
jgi:hypothetical protein